MPATIPIEAIIERLYADIPQPARGCWTFTGALNNGYVRFTHATKRHYAHRFLWERQNGPIPDGMEVDHICRNRACLRPDHWRLATHAQNAQNRGDVAQHSGHRNVYYKPDRTKPWYCRVKINGVYKFSTHFVSLEEAVEAAAALRSEHYTHADPEVAR